MLKASARNCKRVLSPIFVFLNSEMSQRCSPGPRTAPRRAFPGGPAAFGTFTNAAVLNHLSKVWGAPLLGLLISLGRRPAKLFPSRPQTEGFLNFFTWLCAFKLQ